jgi:hypothetical protein
VACCCGYVDVEFVVSFVRGGTRGCGILLVRMYLDNDGVGGCHVVRWRHTHSAVQIDL